MLRILKFVAALLVVVALPPVPASAQVAAPPSSPVSIAGSVAGSASGGSAVGPSPATVVRRMMRGYRAESHGRPRWSTQRLSHMTRSHCAHTCR